MKINKFLIVLVVLFLVPFTTAGLQIVGDSFFKINQTIGAEEIIIFSLRNTETFSFFNVSFEDNPVIEMVEISELVSGASINVTATVSANADFSDNVRIIGLYKAHLGIENKSYEILIDLDGLDPILTPCSFSIIKNENIVWNNLANQTIKLYDINGNELGKSPMSPNTVSDFVTFLEPTILQYYAFFFWESQICTITILDDTGLVYDSQKDAILNLDIDVDYEPTVIETTFLEIDYTMDVFTSTEGLFLIKNVGTETAKSIHLFGEWFEFTQNDFDIQSGYSKTVQYKIKPIIGTTNETDKTYEKNLIITGNFLTITQPFQIFINYADIDSGDYSSGDTLIDIIEQYCIENPDASFCGNEPTVIYSGGNDTNLTQQQFRQIMEYWFSEFENIDEFVVWAKENYFIMSENINKTNVDMNQTRQDVEAIKKEGSSSTNMIFFIIISISGIVIVGGGGMIFWHFKKEKIKEKLRRW